MSSTEKLKCNISNVEQYIAFMKGNLLKINKKIAEIKPFEEDQLKQEKKQIEQKILELEQEKKHLAAAMVNYKWDDVVFVYGLSCRSDLNERAARVCKMTPRADGRIGIQMLIGGEEVWIKDSKLILIPDITALVNPPFNKLSSIEMADVRMFFIANENSMRIPGFPARLMNISR